MSNSWWRPSNGLMYQSFQSTLYGPLEEKIMREAIATVVKAPAQENSDTATDQSCRTSGGHQRHLTCLPKQSSATTACSDGIDNDGDGLVDQDDVGCIKCIAPSQCLLTVLTPVYDPNITTESRSGLPPRCTDPNDSCPIRGGAGDDTTPKEPLLTGCAFGAFEQPLPGLEGKTICDFIGKDDVAKTALVRYLSIVFAVLVGLIAALAMIVIVIGGYMYITAAGSGSQVTTAKTMIGSALLGLVLSLTAWLILNQISPQFAQDLKDPVLKDSGGGPGTPIQPACSDGKDNDGDGLIDTNDVNCKHCQFTNKVADSRGVLWSGKFTPYTPSHTSEIADGLCAADTPACSDAVDNDGDGKIDAADSMCHTDNNPGNPASYRQLDNFEG